MMAVLFSPTDSIARQQAISTKVASRGIAHPKVWVIKDLGHPKTCIIRQSQRGHRPLHAKSQTFHFLYWAVLIESPTSSRGRMSKNTASEKIESSAIPTNATAHV